ncbi:MAG: hypothetical protein A2284_10010 [Deltaproteobacteria bacterium RIFOXYA12_FULL_61_11]|nr:MAG: hypothetical protein A2284_10010 [Deltaproteobacteria bacterium RIFOXYA12_FULL_61_11]
MPELSRFFGIIIRMFVEPNEPHHRPHFHVYYQDYTAVYSIDPLTQIAGSLPIKQLRLVEAWAELHLEELQAAWQELQHGSLPSKIDPLR